MKTRSLTLALALGAMMTLAAGPALAGCGDDHSAAKMSDEAEKHSIVKTAEKAGFKTLGAAIEAAGLTETLDQSGPFTVFAPTDEAFAQLPEGLLESLLADPATLKKVLLYHAVSGQVKASQVVEMESAQSLLGQQLAIATGDEVMINDAKVISTDVMASNGIIHVIDTVLVPENL